MRRLRLAEGFEEDGVDGEGGGGEGAGGRWGVGVSCFVYLYGLACTVFRVFVHNPELRS